MERVTKGFEKGQVIVTVAAKAGAGKSVISRIIEEALKELNVEYKFDDSGFYEYQAKEREQLKGQRTIDKVKEIASECVEVIIKEQSLVRDARIMPDKV